MLPVSKMATMVAKLRGVRQQRFNVLAGGLSVRRFCNLNKLSVHSFQYWAKRLVGTSQRWHSTMPVLTSDEPNSKPMLTIQFGANVEIRIPTDQLDTIKSVLLCCASAQSDSGSFRSVLVRD